MNSRVVPISTALVSFAVAAFLIGYFDGIWRWLFASPLLVLVVWLSLKIGLFSSGEEVDKLTGTDKFDTPTDQRETVNSDRIWGKLNQGQLEAVQSGFMQICLEENLEQYLSTADLPLSVLEKVSQVTNEISADYEVSPAFIPLVVHQYVDSDYMLRVMHRENWASYMASRPDLAPQPESYLDYLNSVYFSGKHAER